MARRMLGGGSKLFQIHEAIMEKGRMEKRTAMGRQTASLSSGQVFGRQRGKVVPLKSYREVKRRYEKKKRKAGEAPYLPRWGVKNAGK